MDKKRVAQLVGAFHRKIAKKVTDDWKLPNQLQATTIYYKRYESAATYLSQLLASWVINPANFKANELIKDPVVGFLNFYPDDGEELFDKKEDVKAMVAAMEI